MKRLLFALIALSSVALANNTACSTPGGALENTVSVSSTTATTIAASVGGQDVHICRIEFGQSASGVVTFQASDGTILAGPMTVPALYSTLWDGQLSTRRAAAGSSFQIKFGTAPSPAIGVTVIYYLTPANSLRQ